MERQEYAMEEMQHIPKKKAIRKKPRSLERIIKEDYLPYGIAALTLLLVIIFIGNAIGRAVEHHKAEEIAASIAAEEAALEAQRQREQAIMQLIANADSMMQEYNYSGARTLLETYSSEMTEFPALQAKYNEVVEIIDSLVEWNDLSKVVNLSFHALIADPTRAFADAGYGSGYRTSHITCSEFSAILGELYANGYILIDLEDMVTISESADGVLSFTPKSLYLPQGKKPLMLTETNVNYYAYMVDGNNDGIADKDGDGFASKLVIDGDGNITAQYINPNGDVITGDFDVVPILERFIQAHPDFSYKGARATLAVSGYEGIFGYRIDGKSKRNLSSADYEQEVAGAQQLVDALRAKGYTIACYTYGNLAYGKLSVDDIQADLTKWQEEIAPILSDVNMLVYAKNSELDDSDYNSAKYAALRQAGFHGFFGISDNGSTWAKVDSDYLRQDRILVTGSNLTKNSGWFSGMFNCANVRDAARD